MNESTASLSTRIVELAHERRRFGYRRIHDLLSLEGHQVNHKRVWRLYKLANLSVRKRRKVKHPTGERQPLAASQHVNDTWSADFVMDALAVHAGLPRPDFDGLLGRQLVAQLVPRGLADVGHFFDEMCHGGRCPC